MEKKETNFLYFVSLFIQLDRLLVILYYRQGIGLVVGFFSAYYYILFTFTHRIC